MIAPLNLKWPTRKGGCY